jgi:hypothetical protein
MPCQGYDRRRAARSAAEPLHHPPLEGPQAKHQINLTDEGSRIMPMAGATARRRFPRPGQWLSAAALASSALRASGVALASAARRAALASPP